MRLAALLMCAALAAPALAQPRPDAITPDGGRYYGPLRDGKLHGRGRLEWPNGSVYEGGFVDGAMAGHGKARWANGQSYEGEFRDGLLSGRGRMTLADGTVYEGDLVKNYFTGEGEMRYPDGRKYRGGFAMGAYQGKGRHESPTGEVYEGEFKANQFTGSGTYRRSDGTRYEGEFLNWRPHGPGRYTDAGGIVYEGTFVNGELDGKGTQTGPQGMRYAGEFKQWRFHGQGELRLPNGEVQSGLWQYGVLEAQQREQRRLASANVETALYNQRALLSQAIDALAPREPGRINLYLLAVGGDGAQEVFRREVEFVRRQFAERFGTGKRSIALVNSRTSVQTLPMATATSIREALGALAARMDRSQDILFVFLTSHGSREHELTLSQNGMDLADLPAAELGRLLRESGIRWKVVVVSACYAGGFLGPLKDDGTLAIAAARHDRQSFGCADENDFTYFGRAYFEKALPKAKSFQDAFRAAERIVHEMELQAPAAPAAAGKPAAVEHSLPQMHSARPIEQQLQRWWNQSR